MDQCDVPLFLRSFLINLAMHFGLPSLSAIFQVHW